MTTDIAVLVVSCDKYQDLWKPFFTLFFKYWQDCPYPVYLGSNHSVYNDSRIKTITIGDDKDWSSGFRKILEQIPHPYVILLLEDYLLKQQVNNDRIQALAAYMKRKMAGCLRLFPCPGPDVPCNDNIEVGEILKESDYRLSLQAAIWDKQVLLRLLQAGETPWQLEVRGSKRTDTMETSFLSVKRNSDHNYPIPYFCTAVVRGKWIPDAVELCKKEGINIDLTIRPLQTWYDRLRLFLGFVR